MRFRKGVGYTGPRWPRGPGRGDPPYRMSRAAYDARLNNLRCVKKRKRAYEETRRNEIEIALGTHRGETYRAMAERLGLKSHAHCWRVARDYRAGLIPMLPCDEQELLELRDSLDHDPASEPAPSTAHRFDCQCNACILCPKCGRERLRAGTTIVPLNPCLCVQHGEDCCCARCRIERIVAKYSPVAPSE